MLFNNHMLPSKLNAYSEKIANFHQNEARKIWSRTQKIWRKVTQIYTETISRSKITGNFCLALYKAKFYICSTSKKWHSSHQGGLKLSSSHHVLNLEFFKSKKKNKTK